MTGSRQEEPKHARHAPPVRGRVAPAGASAARAAHADVSDPRDAAATVIASLRAQQEVIAEFEAVSASLSELAEREDPAGLLAVLDSRDRLLARAHEVMEAARASRERFGGVFGAAPGKIDEATLLDAATRAELDRELAALRSRLDRAIERDRACIQGLAAVRERAGLALAELAVSKRAVSGYATGTVRGTSGGAAATYQDRSA